MDKESENRLKHFAALKSKYQATNYQDSSPSSLLYLILRKVDLEIELSELEFNWLKEHDLFETIEIIWLQKFRVGEAKRLEAEFSHLKDKYKVAKNWESSVGSVLYPILWKLESENSLPDSEVKFLQDNKLDKTVAIFQDIKQFAVMKEKYQANNHQDSSPNSPLYQILKKLDIAKRLSDSEYKWLINHKLLETIGIFEQQELAREAEFAQLKVKYQATKEPSKSTSSQLYPILQKIDADKKLIYSEIYWLEKQGLAETIAIVNELEKNREFAALKAKYKATQYEDSTSSCHLYKVLKKLESESQLSEQDINFLKKRQLIETIAISNEKYVATLKLKIESGETINELEIEWLKNNGCEDIIIFAQQKHFEAMKLKYDVLGYKDKSHTSLLYTILQKLESKERLEPTDVAWLQETKTEAPQATYSYYRWQEYEWQEERKYQGTKLFSGRILIAYHTIEANFYEQEFQRSDNKWNLANASSHWRKANEPEQALQLTNNLEFDKIKENKLKSALLTSRGGGFRDIEKLDKAENCARQAIEYQPKSHHPYTLMGAICFERHQYSDGEYWFQEAIKRGANPRDMDSEIKRVVKNAKDENKRQEVIKYSNSHFEKKSDKILLFK